MPFGLDDLLLLVAAASPRLWRRRGPGGSFSSSSFASSSSLSSSSSSFGSKEGSRLVSSSIAAKCAAPVAPRLPQRRYRHINQKHRSANSLLTSSAKEVSLSLGKYSVAEVSQLYETMQKEGNWKAVLNVTEGAKQGGHYAFLIKKNLEMAIRTLLMTCETDIVVDFCLTYANEVLLSDDIVVEVFDACRNSEEKSLALYETFKPFHKEWTPTLYACCMTVNARYNWKEALLLYNKYREYEHQPSIKRLFSDIVGGTQGVSSNNDFSGEYNPSNRQNLRFLYHIILPLVADRRPDLLDKCYRHMMVQESESAVDVLLRCLHTERGRELASEWLREPQEEKLSSSSNNVNVLELARELYKRKPTVMNLNSFLKLLLTHHPTSLDAHIGDEMRRYLCEVEMKENDASVLARTITDRPNHWKLATYFVSSMIERKHFNVLPSLSSYVAEQGRWSLALDMMTVHLSNRGAFGTPELSLCVEASVFAGRWKSALFWIERAHNSDVLLPTTTYDIALDVSRHCNWDTTLRVLTLMHEVGAVPSSKGILNVLESTAAQGEVEKALHIIAMTGNVYWTL